METRKGWLLLAAAVLFWGVNWPLMKIGLDHIGPLWFAAIRVILGAIVLFMLLAVQGRISKPRRSEMPVLLSVGLVQVGICIALLHSALLFLEAGRTAVLAYTIPIWAAPLAAFFLKERLSVRKFAGIGFGMAGVVALFHAHLAGWDWEGVHPGQAMPLISALLWAGVIVHIRGHGWTRPHLSLLPWQLAIGAVVLTVAAFVFEGPPRFQFEPVLIAVLLFNGAIATAFAFWAYIGAARILHAGSTALGSLAIPVVGLISSNWILGEHLTPSIVLGMALIGTGILLSSATKKAKSDQ
ncbi:MAG: DMT family transporter [Candidatus Sedimenticola sp. 6PFRAG5]